MAIPPIHMSRGWRITPLIWIALLILSGCQAQAADPTYSEVLVSGENGYHLIRTPQILATRDKTLLVFAQGREGHHDQSGNDILIKRSADGGTTRRTGSICVPNALGHQDAIRRASGGSILLNGRGGGRAVAKSEDGGETWSTMQPDPTLTGPACAAGLLRYSFATESGQKSRIIFSLPGSPKGRKHGKIWLSYDEGKSWPVQKKIRPGFFAYSCLARLPDGNIGCVYGSRGRRSAREELGPQNVVFVSFSLDWLTDRS